MVGLTELYEEWLSKRFVLFEMVKCIKGHELSMIARRTEGKPRPVIRYLFASSVDYLEKHIKRFVTGDNLMNFYISCAELKDIPIFSYNLFERRKTPQYKEFNDNYQNYVTAYSFFMDFDGKEDFNKCLEETKEMKKILEEMKVPHYVLNSSFKGFHIIIPSQYMPNKKVEELLRDINEVISNIKEIYNFSTMDTSIGDLKRLRKLPYSPVNDGSVALPLTDSQLANFTPEMVKIENVLKDIKIMNRGLLLRTGELTELELKENVIKFFKEFS